MELVISRCVEESKKQQSWLTSYTEYTYLADLSCYNYVIELSHCFVVDESARPESQMSFMSFLTKQLVGGRCLVYLS